MKELLEAHRSPNRGGGGHRRYPPSSHENPSTWSNTGARHPSSGRDLPAHRLSRAYLRADQETIRVTRALRVLRTSAVKLSPPVQPGRPLTPAQEEEPSRSRRSVRSLSSNLIVPWCNRKTWPGSRIIPQGVPRAGVFKNSGGSGDVLLWRGHRRSGREASYRGDSGS